MEFFLTTYADSNFQHASDRLISEAKSIALFQSCISYSRIDLTNEMLQSPLLEYEKGGGYWSWKPYVVLKTFESMEIGDVLVYVDAGCQLYRHKEWYKFQKILLSFDSIFFNIQAPIERWVKRDVLNYFRERNMFNEKWINDNLFAGGVFFIKKTDSNIDLMKLWHSIMFSNHKLLLDVSLDEKIYESSNFIEHRHDQSVLSILLYNFIDKCNVRALPANFEVPSPFGQAIFAARNNTANIIELKSNFLSYTFWYKFYIPVFCFFKKCVNFILCFKQTKS